MKSSNSFLNYQVYGEENTGMPLLLLHGMLGELKNWNSQAKRFSDKGYSVIAIDLRNHGGSVHLKGMSYRQMAEDVLALLAHLKLPEVQLLGHSMGGKVGMYLALTNPDTIQKLVVVDIAPVAYPLWHQTLFGALLSLPVSQLRSRREADDLLAVEVEDSFERAFLLKNLIRAEKGYQWKCDLQEIAKNYLKISSFPKLTTAYTGEPLFIKGGNSDYLGSEYIASINNYFPGAKLEVINNAGHLPHIQQPDLFYQLVSAYLG